MKKCLFAFFIIVSCNTCFAQGKFQLYLTKACSTVERLDSSYYLMPLNNPDMAYFPKKGIVHLPNKGRYLISFNEGPILDSNMIEIKDTSLVVYRLKESKIQRYLSGALDTPPVYTECDSLLNGYAEDFYPNGNLKIRGNFIKGYPKDSVVTFYATGKLEKRVNILSKVVNIEEYDISGNLIKLSHNQNKSFMTYSEYEWIEYYLDGKVKTDLSSVKRIINIKEFYPTGQLKILQTKNKRIEYYENGNESLTYHWHGKKDDIEKNKLDFTVKEIKFNRNGQMLQSAIFEDWGYFGYPPKLDISKSDWLVSFKKYKDGKEILVVKDMDTKEFIKKNNPQASQTL